MSPSKCFLNNKNFKSPDCHGVVFYTSQQSGCKKQGSHGALQEDPGLGFGEPGCWSRAPESIGHDIIQDVNPKSRPIGKIIHFLGAG